MRGIYVLHVHVSRNIKKEALSVVESLKASKVAATYSHTINALPSAWLSLTTLFGMGRGGTSAL